MIDLNGQIPDLKGMSAEELGDLCVQSKEGAEI